MIYQRLSAAIKPMQKNLKDELGLVAIVFWTTVLGIRFVIFESIKDKETPPAIIINGVHIHHFVVGFILLSIITILYFLKKGRNNLVTFSFAGIGLGLVFDEFIYWAHLSFNYWALGNFFAASIAGIILLVPHRLLKENKQTTPFVHAFHKNPSHPKVSVVIPAFNEEKFLPLTLKSLLFQDNHDFEIIVVNNNSSDRTAEIARSFGAKVIFEPWPGVGFARQNGFETAKAKIIATTDADTILPPNWISRIIQEFNTNPQLVIFGGLYNLYSGSLSARLAIKYLLYWFWRLDKIFSDGWNMPGVNFAVKKEAFLKAGGFKTNLTLGEDIDFSQRVRKLGEVKFDARFRVQTSGRRFRNGLLHGLFFYTPNGIIRMLLKKNRFLKLPTIRKETPAFQKLSIIPLIISIIFLFSLFYISNPTISHARGINLVREKTVTLKYKVKQGKNIFKNSLINLRQDRLHTNN